MKIIDSLLLWLRNVQPILIWIISFYFAHSLVKNGILKLDQGGFWTNAFQKWGYPVWFRILVGVLEMLGGILLLIPRLRYIGGLVLSVVMLGALTTRLIFGTGYEDALYLIFAIVSLLFLASYSYTAK